MLIKDYSFSFGSKKIFSEVNMTFPKGKIVGIVGKNGVGKTTFFRSIKGIYKPQSGSVSDEGRMISNSEIGFLPTDPFFYPYMKGQEYLELVMTGQRSFESLADLFELPLQELVQNYSTTIVSSHVLESMLELCDQIYFIDEGFRYKLYDKSDFQILEQKLAEQMDHKISAYKGESI